MKAALTYWVIGCLIFGAVAAARMNECPNDKLDGVEFLVAIATWPSVFSAVFVFDASIKRDRSCKKI